MKITLVGVNHRTAGVELRERLSYSPQQHETAVGDLLGLFPGSEAVVLSTCNRTELYLASPQPGPPVMEKALAFLARDRSVSHDQLRSVSISREDDQAVAHLFRVAAGLDSMVLGEPQILGQVKRAYESATNQGAVGPAMHLVFQRAIAVGKQVRTTTGIDTGRVSIGSIVVDFAKQIFERFDNKTVVGIGAGEMAKVTLRHLMDLRPAKLWLTNRSLPRATALVEKLGLAGTAGGARTIEDLDALLTEADIVVTSAAAQQPIITAERFEPILRRRRSRPLFLIDIAVPRNIEPTVGSFKNVYLYNLDDLHGVAAQTHQKRSQQIEVCEKMVFDEVRQCIAQLRNHDVGQLIRALKHKLHDLGLAEQKRTGRKLAACDPQDLPQALSALLEEHTRRLINKILHLPLSQLDRRRDDAPLGFYAAALRRLFDLEDGLLIAPTAADTDEEKSCGAEPTTDLLTGTPSSTPAKPIEVPITTGRPGGYGQSAKARR